uniref:DAZ-associated protein 2 n=1 Tax=Sparus aurata TaxID=8175 RepID=A0A671VDU9_SPAAU
MNNKGSYPQQAVYPQQSTAPVYPPAMQMSPQAPPYTDTPPAYSEIYQPRYVLPPQVPGQLPQMSSPYPGAQVFMPMQPHMSVGAMGQNVPMAYYPMGAVYPPGSTVMVDGGFDAGARFTAGSSVSIPPPPPGHPRSDLVQASVFAHETSSPLIEWITNKMYLYTCKAT